MELTTTEYRVIEFAEDEDYGITIGKINIDSEGINYVEIVDNTMFCMKDVEKMRCFLDEVEKEFRRCRSM